MIDLHLTFQRLSGNLLPMNYQYELSSWIYRVIGTADPEHSRFLHERGFQAEGRQFKMFTFSQLDMRPYTPEGGQFRLTGNQLALTVRFLIDRSLESFVRGLFVNQEFFLGNQTGGIDLRVAQVQTVAAPAFRPLMRYACLSPICVSAWRPDGTAAYLTPEDKNYGHHLLSNLLRKETALAGYQHPAGREAAEAKELPEYKFRLLNPPRKKGIHIKAGTAQHTQVIGYLFHFELLAPPELHEIGYYAGFGEKNSMGFGCAQLKRE
jgi:CRISPR-associated endoribonuclease Cas6